MNNTTEQIWDEVWTTAAAGGFITALRLYYNRLLGRLVQAHLTASGSCLELGCGTAQLSLMIAPSVREAVGLDISDAGLAIAKKEQARLGVQNITFVKADCNDVPFTQQFDVVWSAGLIEHFFDRDVEIVRQHIKAVRPGGTAIMSVPYAYSLHSLHYWLTRPAWLRRFWPWSQERHFQKFYSRAALTALGRRIGLPFTVYFLRPWFIGLPLGIIVLEISVPKSSNLPI